MARGNNKGQSKLTAGAVGKGRSYDADTRVSLSNREGEGLPPVAMLDQYVRSHEGELNGTVAEMDASPNGAGQRFKFVSGLDLQRKTGRNIIRDIVTRDLLRDPLLAKHAKDLSVRTYKNDFLENIPAGMEVVVRSDSEHAGEIESRVEQIIDAYRNDIGTGKASFEATISTKLPDGKRINDKFI